MDTFWRLATETHKREQEELKRAAAAAAEKETAEKKEKETAAAKVVKETPLVSSPPPPPPPAPKKEDSPSSTKKKTTKVRRRRRRVSSSSSSSSSIDDHEIVTVGKHVARIRDVNKAYPLFARRHKAAIQKGVRKMVEGDFDEQLTSKEKKSIAQKKRKYKKVAQRRRNPFEDKYKKVGDTYRKFMSEISVKKVDSSSSDTSSSEMSE
jgi:hypothetical protein